MHFLKLSVIAVFLLFTALFLLGRSGSTSVSGKVLDSLLDSPTGFSATDRAYANKVGLRWDTIRGATLYRVFRSTTNDSASAVEVGSTPANYFFDAGAVPETTYFYWVRSENGATISQF